MIAKTSPKVVALSKQILNSKIIQIKGTQQFEAALKTSKNAILNFHAKWCNPCKKFVPRLEKAIKKQKNWVLIKASIDQQTNDDLVVEYKVRSIPTLVIFREGQQPVVKPGSCTNEELEQLFK